MMNNNRANYPVIIGHCPKCGLLGQVGDICKNCGEPFIHHNTTELREANQKISQIYNAQSNNDVVISSKSTTKIIIAVVIALSFVSALTWLLQRKSEQKPYRVSSTASIQQTAATQAPSVIQEAPASNTQPVEDTRFKQITREDTPKTDQNSKLDPNTPRPLTRADVQATMRASGAQIRTCARQSITKGLLKVNFVITKEGRVKNPKMVSPEFSGQPVEACIIKVISNLQFHKLTEEIPVSNYPILIQ